MRDEWEKHDWREGEEFEVPETSNFELRQSRCSRPLRWS
jgi:hypothetical protein